MLVTKRNGQKKQNIGVVQQKAEDNGGDDEAFSCSICYQQFHCKCTGHSSFA